MKSLQLRLSVAVSVVATVVALVAGMLSFAAAFEDEQEAQDRRLQAIASLFSRFEMPMSLQLRSGPEAQFSAYVAVELVGDSRGRLFNLPADVPEGYRTVVVDKDSWRIFVPAPTADRIRVAVGQRTSVRNVMAWADGLWTAVPLLMLVPILSGVIFLLVRRMLKPIAALSSSLDHRTDSDLGPLPSEGIPSEIAPIVAATNSLLQRLDSSMAAQRRFIADAAHELRSPLATLSIQVENVCHLVTDRQAAARLESLRLGIARARALMENLLTLARAETPTAGPPGRCRVETVLRIVLAELLPVADARDIEIVVDCPELLSVAMTELDLTLVFRNLLDNAIRHSGADAGVEVVVRKATGGVCVEVSDHGPGIPDAERERVFDPFYRILGSGESGSGLGLSIVRTIVHRLGGVISLSWTDERRRQGLRVRIVLPVSAELEAHAPGVRPRPSRARIAST